MALSLKQKLFGYFAQRHFDLMSPEVRARFNEYAKNEDFQGNMKDWNTHYVGAMLPDLEGPVPGLGVPNEYQLTDDEWNELYDAYQEAFQGMDVEKIPSIGYANEYKKATLDFIKEWFGEYGTDADGKVFIQKEATPMAASILSPAHGTATDNLAHFLETNPTLKDTFKNNLKETFSDISYDDFIQGLKDKKYNSDTKFRSKVIDVIRYIKDYGPQEGYEAPPRSQWPVGVGYTPYAAGAGTFTVAPPVNDVLTRIYANPDIDKWFEIDPHKHNICVGRFKKNYAKIFDTLLTKSKVREHFFAQTNSSIIKQPINEAIKQTDYENKESKDYVPPKYPDEKNWRQELEEWKNNTYEDYFRKFVEPARGTRLFRTPWSQNIIKAFDKVKIKPTDGLEGILAKKADIAGKLKSSKTSSDHFDWFVKTLEDLKTAGMDKAVEGALRNGKQMQHLVSGLIAEAVKQNKIDEAMTALEVLSVAKYGLLSSRTLDAIREGTKDAKVFSDEKLSWNKNEGIQFVTKAVDKTARAAVIGVSAGIVGINNFIQHRRTKINKDIRNNPILKNAYDHWDERDTDKNAREKGNAADTILNNLNTGNGKSHVIVNATTLATAEADIAALAPGTTNMPAGAPYNGCAVADLQTDIASYKQSVIDKHTATREHNEIQARQLDRARHPEKDPYRKLIAYWNDLETFSRSHSFTLGSMSVKRKAYLNGYNKSNDKNTSQAHRDFEQYLLHFGNLRTA